MIKESAFRLKKNGEPYCDCYCRHPELIENYDKAIADTTQTWECHHRMEAIYTKEELIKYRLYYDREPHQLIFLTHLEHSSLHKKGKPTWNKGLKNVYHRASPSEETRRKIKEANKGNHKGMHWKVVDGKRVWF